MNSQAPTIGTSIIGEHSGTPKFIAGSEEKQVAEQGFSHVFTWTDSPGAHYPPHSHRELTTHWILTGSFTIRYPNNDSSKKVTYGPGSVVDVDAGKVHEVWIGNKGCTYVIGEK